MEYIIDGYNVIKTSYIKKFEKYSIENARTFLIQILSRYRKRHPSIRFTVVFDGTGSFNRLNYREINVIFSHPISADEMIRKILEKRKEREIVVVSDDRQVQLAAKILRAKFSSVSEFIEKISPDRKRRVKPSPEKTLSPSKIIAIEKELREFYERKEIKRP